MVYLCRRNSASNPLSKYGVCCLAQFIESITLELPVRWRSSMKQVVGFWSMFDPFPSCSPTYGGGLRPNSLVYNVVDPQSPPRKGLRAIWTTPWEVQIGTSFRSFNSMMGNVINWISCPNSSQRRKTEDFPIDKWTKITSLKANDIVG